MRVWTSFVFWTRKWPWTRSKDFVSGSCPAKTLLSLGFWGFWTQRHEFAHHRGGINKNARSASWEGPLKRKGGIFLGVGYRVPESVYYIYIIYKYIYIIRALVSKALDKKRTRSQKTWTGTLKNGQLRLFLSN